jgi:hypothetical protein
VPSFTVGYLCSVPVKHARLSQIVWQERGAAGISGPDFGVDYVDLPLDRCHLFDGFSNPDANHPCDILNQC